MGSSISVDSELTTLEDLLSVPLSQYKPIDHRGVNPHLKLWRFFEDAQTPDRIQSRPMSLTEPQSFKSKECYLILLTYSKIQLGKFAGYPSSIYPTVESLSNLSPRGLETIFSTDQTSLQPKADENDVHFTLYAWNGKSAGAFLKAYTLTKGFELDAYLSKGKSLILQNLLSGFIVKAKTLSRSALISLDSTFNSDKTINKHPDFPVSFLQNLWTEPVLSENNKKPLFPRVRDYFFNSSEPPVFVKVQEEKPALKMTLAIKGKADVDKPKLDFGVIGKGEGEKPKLDLGALGNNEAEKPKLNLGGAGKAEIDKPKLEIKPKLTALSLSGLKTREDERVQLQNLTKKELDMLDDNPDVRDTNRKEIKLQYYSEVISELYPGLFVGSDLVARNKEKLISSGVTHIINCAANVCRNYFPESFQYLHFFLKDSRTESIECVFYPCIHFIEDAIRNGGKVLVHCMQGVSRSVTICLSYIIFKNRRSFEDVFSDAKSARSICSPNTGFQVQLIWWYKRLCEDYDSVPINPRVFAVGSHQKEQPLRVVTRLLTQPLYFGADYFTLDSRGVFLVQSAEVVYLWIGKEIPKCNRNVYLQVALKQYEQLERFERAGKLVEVNEGQETEEFWRLWSEDIRKSQFIDQWNAWYPYLDQAVDEEPQEMDQEVEEEVVLKPKLYIFPENTGIGVFDDEELIEDALLCLCTPEKCFVWKGFEAEASEKQEKKFLAAVTADYYGESRSDFAFEEPGDESYEFLNYF